MTHYLYVFQADKYALFKIGHTNNPKQRMQHLQTGSPYQLKEFRLYEFPDRDTALIAEKRLLGIVHQYALTTQGEWYTISVSLLRALLFEAFMRTNILHDWNARAVTDAFIAP